MDLRYWIKMTLLVLLAGINVSDAQINTFPYLEQFNVNPTGWTYTTNSGSPWTYGIPSVSGNMGAYSPMTCVSPNMSAVYMSFTNSMLTTPRFDISGLTNPVLTFMQFRNMTHGSDGMHVEYSVDDVQWLRLGAVIFPNSFNWYNANSISATGLPAFTGGSNGKWIISGGFLNGLTSGLIRFRFVFRSSASGSQLPGIFLDDIMVRGLNQNPVDVGIISMNTSTQPNVVNGKTACSVFLRNNSTLYSVDSLYLGYMLNGVLQSNTKQAVNLLPGYFLDFFVDSISIPPGQYQLTVFITRDGDLNFSNDTIYKSGTFTSLYIAPYSTDFEAGSADWYVSSTGSSKWEWGQPAFGVTTGAHSGNFAWDVNLNTAYGDSANTYLYTPEFILDPTKLYQLSFWQQYMTQQFEDGMRIEYSYDGGLYWYPLGWNQDTCGMNWVGGPTLYAVGGQGWSGASNGWKKSTYRLTYFLSLTSIKFRFIFKSDELVNSDGYSIDDFKIETIPTFDAAAMSINKGYLHPSPGQQSPSLQLKFINTGIASFSSYIASYSVNGVTQQSASFSGLTINPLDIFDVVIPGFIPPTGNFDVCASISVPSDSVPDNDFTCLTTSAVASVVTPYTDDFESGAPGWWTQNDLFETRWELGTPSYGNTNSTHSGSNAWDINLDTSYGRLAVSYLYLPPLNLVTANPCKLSFWLNNSTESKYDGVYLEYSTNQGYSWHLLGNYQDTLGENWYNLDSLPISNNPGWSGVSAGWERATYRLDNFAGVSRIDIRFRFESDYSVENDGFSIDDVSVEEINDFDGALISFAQRSLYPPYGYNSGQMTLVVANAGAQPISGFTYGYTVGGVIQQTSFYSATLLPLDSVILTLPGHIVNAGVKAISGFISLTNDSNATNDSLHLIETGIPLFTPYFQDDFNGPSNGWVNVIAGDDSTNWELGSPNYGTTNSAYSAPLCWDINLDSAYYSNANTMLLSPWFDFSTVVHPKMKFWQNRNINQYSDALNISWRSYNDTTWNLLGDYQDPAGVNWYNYDNSTWPLEPGWKGNSNGWIKSELELTSLIGYPKVQFRFNFKSDHYGIIKDGVSIDDFKIEVQLPVDVELTEILTPGFYTVQNNQYPVTVRMRNNSIGPVSSAVLKYSLNGGGFVSAPWTGSLDYDSTTLVVLPPLAPAAGTNHLVVVVEYTGDLCASNDTVEMNFYGHPVSPLPYFEDFEASDGGMAPENLTLFTEWEYGTPAFGTTNSAYSGVKCWDVNLNTPYSNAAFALLETPFFDLGANNIITLSFWHNYNSELNADGMYIEYSYDGINWSSLGTIGDPNAINWFNSNVYSGMVGWSGNSSGWVNSSYVFTTNWGENFLIFRFVFRSDFTFVNSGVSIDDVAVSSVAGVSEGEERKVVVFPNPAREMLNLHYDLPGNVPAYCSIINSIGEIVHTSILPTDSKEVQISLKDFASGIYYNRILQDGKLICSAKFIVLH